MEKYQAAGRLVIGRPYPVVSEEKKVSRLDLFVLCVQGRRDGKSSNFSLSRGARGLLMKVEYFLRKYIWYVEKYGVIGGPCPAVSFKSS